MHNETTLDYFLDHGFAAYQFKNSGHRSGMDAIMLASAVPASASGLACDLGAGAGVVGLAVAHRCLQVQLDLFEIDAELTNLSRQSLLLEQNSHLARRVAPHCADVANSTQLLTTAQRKPGSYDYILSNPPYNDASHRPSPDGKKTLAHQASNAAPAVWIKSAANLAAHGGKLVMIVRPENLLDYLEPLQRRFGGITIKPLHSRDTNPANRILLGATKGSRGALKILSPLFLHTEDGKFTGQADDILRGRRQIDLFA